MHVTTIAHSTGINPAQALPVPWRERVSRCGALVRLAKARLQDPMRVENVVHDLFEAVVSGRAAFGGRHIALLAHRHPDIRDDHMSVRLHQARRQLSAV